MSYGRFGSPSMTRASVPVRSAGDSANHAANVAAVQAMSDCERVTGMTVAELDAKQAELRARCRFARPSA